MGSIVPFLIWLICIGIAAIMVGYFIQTLEYEGFTDATGNTNNRFLRQSGISITTCPTGSSSYITNAGNTNCCDGDIVNNVCNGNDMCSLSPSIQGGLDSCGEWITKEWAARSEKFCGTSMPYYFGTLARIPGSEGCSASLCKPDGSKPEDENMPQCKIYGNLNDELSNINSCYNASAKDAMVCPQANATKSMISYDKNTPVILTCNYIPKDGSSSGIPTTCMDVARSIKYIESLPSLPSEEKASIIANINSTKDSRFCNYVDSRASSTGWMISGDGLPSTEVTKVISPVPFGPYQGNTLLLAEYGGNIIKAHVDKNGKVLNDRTGNIIAGKLSDFNIVTYDDIFKMRTSLYKAGSQETDLRNMSATKV